MTQLLESNGWRKAEAGEDADVAIWFESEFWAEGRSGHCASRLPFFSRMYLDLLGNKRGNLWTSWNQFSEDSPVNLWTTEQARNADRRPRRHQPRRFKARNSLGIRTNLGLLRPLCCALDQA